MANSYSKYNKIQKVMAKSKFSKLEVRMKHV
jgi:hypothetical protein